MLPASQETGGCVLFCYNDNRYLVVLLSKPLHPGISISLLAEFINTKAKKPLASGKRAKANGFQYSRRESNPQLPLRRGLLYPFNYESLMPRNNDSGAKHLTDIFSMFQLYPVSPTEDLSRLFQNGRRQQSGCKSDGAGQASG